VNNTNLHPVSHRFQVIAAYWSISCFRRGVPFFNTLDRSEPLNSRLRNSA